ncbi:hypothetical protein ACNKHN_08500 [Shigella flexneri]
MDPAIATSEKMFKSRSNRRIYLPRLAIQAPPTTKWEPTRFPCHRQKKTLYKNAKPKISYCNSPQNKLKSYKWPIFRPPQVGFGDMAVATPKRRLH